MRLKQSMLAMAIAMPAVFSAHAGEIEFSTTPVPTSDFDKRSVLSSQYANVDGERVNVKYNTLLRVGDKPDSAKRTFRRVNGKWIIDGGIAETFGTIYDIEGEPVVAEDGSVNLSNTNDFASLLTGSDNNLYMVSHFEARPAAMYLTQLEQNESTGELTPLRTRHLDFSHVNGGWTHCAGSVTPWGTHLGSEEYPPNAKEWRDSDVSDYNAMMVRYFPEARGAANDDLPALALQYVNPYDYGFNVEVDVSNYDTASVVKHYAMGRVAIELSYVMPNQKTVYISDDGSKVGLFRFEADNARDLSSGTLYAAKWTQTSPWTDDSERIYPLNGGTANISWIALGHATDSEIRAIINSGVGFSDIFDEDVAGCTTISNRDAHSGECLKVKPGMEKAAAFLESSRYAGILGATIEFEKMEGITHDPATNTMYLAMSRVKSAMSDGEGDISVPYNYCGTVYALGLDANYVARNMRGVVSGIPRLISRGASVDKPYPSDGPYAANQCDLDGISEPDNVTFMKGYKTLIIGEDTGKHQNDMIWAYNVETGSLTRVQTTPYGSETTSPYFYPDVNGFAYVMSVIQHPFGESDRDALEDESETRAYTGYLGPLPAMTEE